MADRYALLKQGLVGCWIPSISGSGLLLPDLSGRGNNGSLVGMDASDWVSASYGRALDFDGVDDKATAAHPLGVSVSQCTFSVWMRKTSASDITISSIGSETANSRFHISWFSDGQLYCTVENGASSYGEFTPSFTSNFRNYCLVYDGTQATNASRLRVFLDGQQVSLSYTGTIPSTAISSNVVAIGAGSGSFSKSQQDDIRIYNRALTEPEIKLLSSEPGIGFKPAKKLSRFSQRFTYKPAKPRNYSVIRNRDPNYSTLRQGLVAAYCPSISGQGNVLPDLVGGNHGTLTNMTADDWVSSGDGRALDFANGTDYVAISNTSITGTFSASMWFSRRTIGGGDGNCLLGNTGSGNTLLPYVQASNYLIRTDAGASQSYALPTLAAINHVVVIRDQSNNVRVFTNGVESTSGAKSISGTFTINMIGRYQVQNYGLDGIMDDIRIYNRALSESEIKLLASKRGIGLEPRKPKITFADLGVQKTYSVVRVKETDYATLRQGLVGAWCPSLPNGGSGNTLPDVSGYGNHGTLTNMLPDAWVSAQYGRALRLNRAATKDNVNFGNVCYQPNDFSVSFFVNKIATSANAYGNLWAVSRWNTGASPGTNEFACLLSNGSTGLGDTPAFVIAIGVNEYTIVSSASLRLGFFDHVCCVRFADTIAIYVNGVNRGTTTGVPTTAITNLSRNLKLGDSDITSDQDNNAMFDDIRIYSRALSESEIRLLASRPGIGLRQESHRNTFYQFPSGARRKRILTGMP